MSPPVRSDRDPDSRFPRVSGDEPAFSWIQEHKDLFSPRERG